MRWQEGELCGKLSASAIQKSNVRFLTITGLVLSCHMHAPTQWQCPIYFLRPRGDRVDPFGHIRPAQTGRRWIPIRAELGRLHLFRVGAVYEAILPRHCSQWHSRSLDMPTI